MINTASASLQDIEQDMLSSTNPRQKNGILIPAKSGVMGFSAGGAFYPLPLGHNLQRTLE
jgi:hypothetical protein